MLDFIEGEIISKEPQRLVLRAGDIGFGLKVSNQTLASLPPQGGKALVYANLQMREDDISLYGFSTREERTFFELLIQTSGIGAKLALTVLSSFPVDTIKKAIVTGDLATLTGISGIGKKTAQRMILEMKDKLDKELLFADGGEGFGAILQENADTQAGQAVEALEALGYTRAEIVKAFSGMDIQNMDVESLVRAGLKHLAGYSSVI